MPFATRALNQLEPSALVAHFIACPPKQFAVIRLASGMTAFDTAFDVLTTAEPHVRARAQRLPFYRLWSQWLRPKTRFIGATVTEYAWLPPELEPDRLARSLRDDHTLSQPLLIVKDLPKDSPLLPLKENEYAEALGQSLLRRGFVLVEGQALAWVPITFSSIDEYLSRLSRGRRRNIRRKLRSRNALMITRAATGPLFSDEDSIDAFHALYKNVYAQSTIHFDELDRAFIAAVLRDADSGGTVAIYHHDGRMIGWNLCYEYEGALVDKYMGLVYPDARDHNLYAVSWVENLQYALSRGLTRYIAGWTDPQVKAELGAHFTFTRHAVYVRNPLLRLLLRGFARFFESDRQWRETRAAHAAVDS